MIFNVSGSKQIDIQPGDWVDLDSSFVTADPQWGFSFQVIDIDVEDNIWCNLWNGVEHEQATVSPSIILDNFRKVPFEE